MKPSRQISGRAPAPDRLRTPDRGAVLIVALLVMAVIALALASYMNLSLGSARLARHDYKQAAAFDLAEAGAEEALWSCNQADPVAAWSAWTVAAGTAHCTLDGFDLGANSTGKVKVYLDNFSTDGSTEPTVYALSTVQSPGDVPVSKMIEVTLRHRARFSSGLTALQTLSFAGAHTSMDSWNSDPDNDPATPAVDYSSGLRNDQGSIAGGVVLVNEAAVWGYVVTGGAAPSVGAFGSITGHDTALGLQVDPARVATDFNASLPNAVAPAGGTYLDSLGATLGTAGQATLWRCPSLTLTGNQTLTIYGDVTLVLTAGTASQAIDVTGNGSIIVTAGSRLTVYAQGNVLVAGNGLANANVAPATCAFFGTSTDSAGQSIQLAGNGALRAVVYAPDGDVKINGDADVMGAIVGRNITLVGNASFHYDESLNRPDPSMPYGAQSWSELTSASDRQAQAAKFSGW